MNKRWNTRRSPGEETVGDAYCGTGTIGLIAARRGAKQVVGVEINREAVRDAIANAKRNQIKNARFYCADAGAWMRDMAAAGEQADVVLMDPPRAGSDEAFLSSVLTLAPKRVVYISCNPETLARDVLFLTKRGYRVQRIQPVDMFPFTNHIEAVVLLTRQKTKRKAWQTSRSRQMSGCGRFGFFILKTAAAWQHRNDYLSAQHFLIR